MHIKSTKSFLNMPCGHSQWFDTKADGTPGECAGVHGYDRSFHFVFAGEIDEYGWIFPFGELKPVKDFLEYYFDHTTVLGADDPRLEQITEDMCEAGGLFNGLRVLPYGVSMEMSSLFIWEHVNPYVYHTTGGRCYVERIEIKEHERNSGILEVGTREAILQAQDFKPDSNFMQLKPVWEHEPPQEAYKRILIHK